MLSLPPGTEFEPTEDQIWCRLYTEQTGRTAFTHGKIILPDTTIEELFLARAIKVGPGRAVDIEDNEVTARAPLPIKPGDDFIFRRYRGERVQLQDGIYIVMSGDDVLMKVNIPTADKKKYFRWLGASDDLGKIDKARISK